MKTYRRLVATTFFLIGFLACLFAQNVVLIQTNESGIYKNGEKIQVKVLLKENKRDSITIKVRENYSDNISERKIKYSGDTLVVFDKTFNESATTIIEVSAGSKPAIIGLVVDPDNFNPGTKRPKDFNRFWKQQKKELRSLSINVKSKLVKDIEPGYSCSDVDINCTGPKPARGYFAKPESAEPKTLPIVLFVHAAGVKGSWCLSQPENAVRFAKMGKGTLAFDLNAHGMLNGQPQEYYDKLEQGELKNFPMPFLLPEGNQFVHQHK